MKTSECCAASWEISHPGLRLPKDETHVWSVQLDEPPIQMRRLLSALAFDERKRAERFRFPIDRNRFIVARGLLRSILGGYLNMEPGLLRFGYGAHGKPILAGEDNQDDLRFNVSHSQGIALFALTRGRELGVDIERIRPHVADERIAERFFSPRETAQLRALPADLQAAAFFNCWTRKEAYIKALGEGLSLPLDRFDVSLVPGEPAALLENRIAPEEVSRWSFDSLAPMEGFAAALVVEGGGWHLKCWRWLDEKQRCLR